MAPFYAPGGMSEILPRYSFIEPLLAGRRVLEVGAAGASGGSSAIFLAERGAAAVLSLDTPEAVERAAAASHHPFVQFRSGDPGALPAGAFDLAIVTDGTPLATDPARVAELKALLAPGGILVAAIPVPGGAGLLALAGMRPFRADEVPAYESFAGALAAEFEAVEFATQSAMLGYVLAPGQAGDDPEITVDGALAGPAEAAYYLAVCGAEPSGLEGLTLVALPPRPLADAAAANGEAARAHAQCLDTGALESEVAELRQVRAAREEALVAKDAEIAESLARLAERDRLLAEKDAALAELEVAADAARVHGQGVAADLEREREARFEVQAALDRAQAAAREGEAERDALRESEASAQASRAEAQAARAAVQSALTRAEEAEARAAELEQALDDARRRELEVREETETGLAAREVRSAELEARSAELGVRAAELEARAAELQADLARSREELEANRRELDAQRARADGAEAEGASLRSEVAEARARLLAAEAKGREAGDELARRAEAEALGRQELERVGGQLEAQLQALARLESEVTAARGAAEESEAQAAVLEAELQAVRWEKDEIEQKLQAQGSAAAQGGQAAEVAEALERLTRERDAALAQLADRETRLAKLQRELADKTERLGRLAKEVGELKSKGIAEQFSR